MIAAKRRSPFFFLPGQWFLMVAALVFTLASMGASAQGYTSYENARAKLSTDLRNAIAAPSVSGTSWARDTYSGRLVKVLVIADASADPELGGLRAAIVAAGG